MIGSSTGGPGALVRVLSGLPHDLDAAIDNAVTAAFLHSGQVCSAGARLIVEESLHDQFVDEVMFVEEATADLAHQFTDGGGFVPARDAHRDGSAALLRRCRLHLPAGHVERAHGSHALTPQREAARHARTRRYRAAPC